MANQTVTSPLWGVHVLCTYYLTPLLQDQLDGNETFVDIGAGLSRPSMTLLYSGRVPRVKGFVALEYKQKPHDAACKIATLFGLNKRVRFLCEDATEDGGKSSSLRSGDIFFWFWEGFDADVRNSKLPRLSRSTLS